MKKIISLFQRNYDGDRLVRDEIVPGAEWVIAGEGEATRKFDGTCCMMKGGQLYLRYDAKQGRTPPIGFEPAQEPDSVTGHWPGWVRVGDDPAHRWHKEAWKNSLAEAHVAINGCVDGTTFELCGPKVQGNPEGFKEHLLVLHGCEKLDAPRTFDGLKKYLETSDIEGIVWHHPDGRMVKIKKKDFGFKRNSTKTT